MEGGAETGFRHNEPVKYKPRLLHVFGDRRNMTASQVPLAQSRLNSDDVFILDLGTTIYQWNGKGCNKDERFKGMQMLNALKSERPRVSSETLEETDTPKDHSFYKVLTEQDEEGYSNNKSTTKANNELYRVSDADKGRLAIKKVKEGRITTKDMDSLDVFILDTGKQCFVWIGNKASPAERQNGFGYAHSHLMKTSHPLIPIVVIKEGQKNSEFSSALAA
jgi:gelsolin